MDAKTGSRGLILKMVEAGEETFCGMIEIQGVFGKRVDSFSPLECEVIEHLLYEV